MKKLNLKERIELNWNSDLLTLLWEGVEEEEEEEEADLTLEPEEEVGAEGEQRLVEEPDSWLLEKFLKMLNINKQA